MVNVKRFLIALFVYVALHSDLLNAKATQTDTSVIMLHGLGRTRLSMVPLRWYLENEGMKVHNLGFCSHTQRIPELAEEIYPQIINIYQNNPNNRWVFIGFSTGGSIINWILKNADVSFVSSIVFIVSPLKPFIKKYSFLWWTNFIFPPVHDFTVQEHEEVDNSHLKKFRFATISAGADRVVPYSASVADGASFSKLQKHLGHTTTLYSHSTMQAVAEFIRD